MNKIATSMIICGMAIVSFADPVQEEENTPEEEQTTVNVYDMTISAKVPYLKSGIRAYSSQKMSGHMYLVYDEDDILSDIYAVVTNAKTKVVHKLSLNGGSFYNLIGK